MNKTLTINLNGIVFNIDEDAYSLLNEYLNNLKHAFSHNEGKDEIIADIEARICEILSDKITNHRAVISLSNIEDIITIMGKPEELEIDDESTTSDNKQAPPPIPPSYTHKPKRLFRNPLNKMLGGVCSGIGTYLNIDTTWVRLIFVGICFLTFTFPVGAYIVLWIILPEAKNATDQLAMKGEVPSIENIGETVKSNFERNSANQQISSIPHSEEQGFKKIVNTFFSIIITIFKVIVIGTGIICVPIILALGLALVVCISIAIIFAIGQGTMIVENIPINWSPNPTIALILASGIILVLMIPLIFLSYITLKKSFKLDMSNPIKITLVILFAIGLSMSGISIGLLQNF